ncbi:hypothetical protein P885DRAFT_57170 [Corynascus similis CBS 632.67]
MRLLAILAVGCSLSAALPDAPTPENFLRRAGAKAVILGDYVYIHGGELNQLVDGEASGTEVVNSTLSIDMSKSWLSSTVDIRTIPNPGPRKSNVGLWTDRASGAFYTWGGRWPGGRNMSKPYGVDLWRFTADGEGGGSWEIERAANGVLLANLHPTEYGAFVNTESVGFIIGGVADAWTEPDHPTADPIPGMVSYNMKTRIWQNGTVNFSPFGTGTLNQGAAEYVPSFGPHGLIIVLGGYAPSITGDLNKSDGPPLDLRNLTFFNPETKERYWQLTTGDIPPTPRGSACTAAFPTADGGYDIFLFGGSNGRDEYNYEDAYILSLPGFVWTKVPDAPGGARTGHSCLRVGKRQVLSVGGVDASRTDKDDASQGLLLFDMTTWQWGDAYDSKAADYVQAKTIKEWYANGSLDNVEWSSRRVKKLFAAAVTSATSTGSTATRTGDPVTDSDSDASSDSEDSKKTPVGAIVGGVMGGIAVVAIVVAASWVFIRRRQKQQQHQESATGQNDADNDHTGATDPSTAVAASTSSLTPNKSELPGFAIAPSTDGGYSPYSSTTATTATPLAGYPYQYYYVEKDTDLAPGVRPGPGVVPAEVSGAGHEYTELPSAGANIIINIMINNNISSTSISTNTNNSH